MPILGADMEEGTLVEWQVKPGDRVKRGDIVAVVETEKGDIEVEVFETGVVEEILVPWRAGPVGTPLAVGRPNLRACEPNRPRPRGCTGSLRVRAGPVARPSARPAPLTAAPAFARPLPRNPGRRPARAPTGPLPERGGRGRSPARRPADLGVDLASSTGSGPHGAVRQADVLRLADAGQAVPAG